MLRDLSRNSSDPVETVPEAPRAEPAAVSPIGRIGLGVLGAVLLAVLVIAALLQPDSRGFGTHEQLRLAPCWFQAHYGMPCPSCGMTTAFAHLVRLQLAAAFEANVAGTLLGIGAMVIMPWSLGSAVSGRILGERRAYTSLIWGLSIIVVAGAIQWSAWLTR